MSQPERLRLFLAATVPDPLLARLEERTRGLRAAWPAARWTPPQNQHVTLKFLGSVERHSVDPVFRVAREVSAAHRSTPLKLSKPGVFPSSRRARVLWAGLEDPEGVLTSLAERLATDLEPLGFDPERRRFTAHLTLARFREPVRVDPEMLDLDLSDLDAFEVKETHLFRSHLSPKGARYEILESFALQ